MPRDEANLKSWPKSATLATMGVLALLGMASVQHEWTFGANTWLPQKRKRSRRTNRRNLQLDPLPKEEHRILYSHAATDRTGHALMDMMKAQADCFAQGWEYGGACGYTKRHELNAEVIKGLGLENVIRYACPDDPDDEANYLPEKEYRHDELEDFTQDWFDFMKVAAPTLVDLATQYSDDDVFRIAAHIRRGDVSLCTPNAWKRYLPKSHYIRLIDQILEKIDQPYEVTIFSEAPYSQERYTQYEDFQVFEDKNYTVFLGGDMIEVWKEFIAADVIITAKSAFSVLPAFLRLDRGGVIFTPFIQDSALPNWEVVDEDFMAVTDQEMYEMERMVCPEHGEETDRDRFVDFAEGDT